MLSAAPAYPSMQAVADRPVVFLVVLLRQKTNKKNNQP
jgi:hypothetical protein